VPIALKSGNLSLLESSRFVQAGNGIALPLSLPSNYWLICQQNKIVIFLNPCSLQFIILFYAILADPEAVPLISSRKKQKR
jgi:hypothetical protein